MSESPAGLRAQVDAAVAARRARSPEELAGILARAAIRWRSDPRLAELAVTQRTSPAMIAEVAGLVAGAIHEEALRALITSDPGGDGPALVGHVLASNVPALAVPAIVHALLVGAAVVLKSGRADRISAVAFRDAVAAEDGALAATIVPAYWAGADPTCEAAAFGTADVVLGTGGDAMVGDLSRRLTRRFLAFGERSSLCVIARDATDDVDTAAAAIARDVALYEQRGCLSPHAVFIEGADATGLRTWGDAIGEQLDALAAVLPRPAGDVAERAAVRAACDEAEWAAGAVVRASAGGAVVLERHAAWRPPIGDRTVRVLPLQRLADLAAVLPRGRVESVGAAGEIGTTLSALRAGGVSRVCPLGTMQAPPIHWPRGQHPPLAALRGAEPPATMLVEP